MDPAKRIIINTTAQYIKAVFTTVLSLYSTRLILDALTISDYGIYTVVGGVVSMLGFITNALVITTQRYISVFYGKNDLSSVKSYFANSLFLHLILGALLCIVLFCLKNWLMNDVLTIPPQRLEVANHVYSITIIILFLTIMMAPFKALFIARENIIYIALIETVDAIIKLVLALGLCYIQTDKLLFYAVIMALIVFLNFLAFSIYAFLNFKECSIIIRKGDLQRNYITQLAGFAGWTTYGMGAIAGRNQGTAVVINHFFGTTVNAAYGIAFQVNGALSFVVTSILNAMNPQIMKSEGGNNREGMLHLASLESKYSAALLSIVTIPLIIEMHAILSFWLKEVPQYTCMFCQFILVGFICDQLTMGLQSANQAMGNIRNYTLLIYTPKLIFLPIIWIMFSYGCNMVEVMWLYLIIEIGVALVRIIYTKIRVGLNAIFYIRSVILPQVPICLSILVVGLAIREYFDIPFRFILTYIISASIGIISTWFFAMNKEEQAYAIQLIKKHICHDQS